MSAPSLGGPRPPQRARSVLENILYDSAKLQPDELHFRLDAYAHELAEKIRNSKALRDFTDDHMGDCNMAADLIDPEVGR